jgi:toxin ParE1/3/4
MEAFVAGDDPVAASELILGIRSATALLVRHPAAGRPGRIAGTREFVVEGAPYIIPYRARPGSIELIRVLHGARRRPGRL